MKTIKMKKMLSTLLLAIMLVGSITVFNSCGSDSKFVGEWKLKSMTYAGQDVTGSTTMDFDIKGSGKFTVDANGTKGTGKWSEKDGVITLTDDSEDVITGELVDGNIQMVIQGVTVTLQKK